MSSRITAKQLETLKERDGGVCVAQGPNCLGEGLVPHHRANRGSGGAGKRLDAFSNLLLLCAICNGWVEDSHGEDRDDLIRRGIRLLPDSTHAKTALRALTFTVTYPDGRTFYLLDDGTREEEKRGLVQSG